MKGPAAIFKAIRPKNQLHVKIPKLGCSDIVPKLGCSNMAPQLGCSSKVKFVVRIDLRI